MKSKIMLVFILVITLALGSCKNYDNEFETVNTKLDSITNKIENIKIPDPNTSTDQIFFNVKLDQSYNENYQLVHIEGKYSIPYIILAKFNTNSPRSSRCKINSVKLKIQSIDGQFYKFKGTPTLEIKNNVVIANVDITIGNSPNSNTANLKIKGKINTFKKQIFDIHVVNSPLINDYFSTFDESNISILCCSGVICKSLLDFEG